MIAERLTKLRQVLKENKIDYYIIPTADFHNSEYVSDYFKVREYFSGFTGSNGTLVVWQEGAGLWTDGRYFIQAEKELENSTIHLYRMLDDGVPTIEEFLIQNMKQGQVLGFDGRVVDLEHGKKYENALKEKKIEIKYEQDYAEVIWWERPALPEGKLFIIPTEIAGLSVKDKLEQVRTKLKEEKVDGILLTKLDDLMWLFNIRGCDVELGRANVCTLVTFRKLVCRLLLEL